MRVLLIDQLSPSGHLKYVQAWIECLNRLNIRYEIIGKKEFIERLIEIKKENKISIPNKYYENIEHKNIIIREIYLIKLLRYINKNIDLKKYNKIFFLSFENISIFLSFFLYTLKPYLILHNNLRRIDETFTYFILKVLSKKMKLISLDDFIKEELNKRLIKSERVIHPILEIEKIERKEIKEKIIIFSPSITSIDEKLIKSITSDDEIKKILEEKNIQIILRTKFPLDLDNDNITVLNNYLDKNDYNNYLNKADIIFLPYVKNFKLRVSAVFFESIYLKKSLIIPKYNDLKYFLKFKTSSISGFKDLSDLKEILKTVERILEKKDYQEIYNTYSINTMKKDIEKILFY